MTEWSVFPLVKACLGQFARDWDSVFQFLAREQSLSFIFFSLRCILIVTYAGDMMKSGHVIIYSLTWQRVRLELFWMEGENAGNARQRSLRYGF
jgi:hypothetical protein